MVEKKINRKRWVQVKLRLTPEENAVLNKDVKDSGLSKNDYLIKTLINRIGLPAINCERKYWGDSVDISFTIKGKRIGYASCLFFENLNRIQVSSFYVIKPFQDIGIEEILLQEILDYADLNHATSVIAYPGTEPYCPTEWKPMDVQTKWYESNGFRIDHMINNIIPCLIKEIPQEEPQ